MAASKSLIRRLSDRYVASGMPRRAATNAARRFFEQQEAREKAVAKKV